MKDIREIMMEMDNLTKDQLAIDLTEEEKEELISLINTDDISTNNSADTLGCKPDPTFPPTCMPTGACGSQAFCCIVTFPKDLTVIRPLQINTAIVPSNLTVTPNGTCTANIGGCTIILNKAKISACAKIFVSLGVKDTSGNSSFVCCSDCVFLCSKDVICCGTPNVNNIKFMVSNPTAVQLTTGCTGAPGNNQKQIWQITGNLTFTCHNQSPSKL